MAKEDYEAAEAEPYLYEETYSRALKHEAGQEGRDALIMSLIDVWNANARGEIAKFSSGVNKAGELYVRVELGTRVKWVNGRSPGELLTNAKEAL